MLLGHGNLPRALCCTRSPIQVHLSHASGSLALRHLHPGDWLGRPDSLALRISAGGGGTYYNPLVDAREHFIEPWVGRVDCHSEIGEITTQLRVEVSNFRECFETRRWRLTVASWLISCFFLRNLLEVCTAEAVMV